MGVVQILDKPNSVKSCKDLSDHFCREVTHLFHRFEEVHLIFDRYDVENSLKTETHSRRMGSIQSIALYITDSNRIENVSMKLLLSSFSSRTKDELSTYFAVSLTEYVRDTNTNKGYVTAYRNNVISTSDQQYLASSQEDADTTYSSCSWRLS